MRFSGKILSFWGPLLLLSLLAFLLQTHMYLHRDVAYILHEGKLMLQGETYTKTIYEPNPPLILFLSIPPWLLAKISAMNILITFRLYVIFLAFISCSLTYLLIKKLFSEKLLVYLAAYTVIFTLLFLPAHQFGQREHLLMIFIYPYLFARGLRLEGKSIPTFLAIFIGVMAGIGFAIKPHFLLAFLLIESYCLFQTRHLVKWLRVETIFAILFILIYIASIVIFFKAYIDIIYPLWWPFYKAIQNPWATVLTNVGFLFCLGPLVFCFLMKKYDSHSSVTNVFLFALIGFIVAFLQPRVTWYYHLLPALSIACVIYAIWFAQFLLQTIHNTFQKSEWIFIAGLAFVFFAFPVALTCGYSANSIKEYRKLDAYESLITFLQNEAPDNQYIYFANTHNLSILEYYANTSYIGRFPMFWWFFDLTLEKYYHSEKAKLHREKYFPALYNLVAEDLMTKKPKFVIVDKDSPKENLAIDLNYVNELSRSPKFRIAWRKYHYYKTLDQYRIYVRNE